MKTNTFTNQVTIVTRASSGIGKALSLHLADEGVKLSLAARNAERLDALARDCQSPGLLDKITMDDKLCPILERNGAKKKEKIK